MIKDSNGDELIYWPISGLIEGQNSEVLDFTADVPGTESMLSATLDTRINIWAKRVGDASYINISVTQYDLTGVTGAIDFQCYIEALTPISGLERIPANVIVGTSSPAGWEA